MAENQHIEYKQSWRDEYLKWVCGFANAEGGLLVIGRNDRGAVVGIANARRLLEELPNKVRDMLGILVDVNLRSEAGKDYLEIRVDAYPNPVSYKGEYYYRSGSTNQMLKGAALLRRYGRTWDSVPLPGVALADLDTGTLQRFRQRAARSKRLAADALAEDDARLIDKLRLTEGRYLRRSAVLLFHPDPERFFTGAFVKIGYFASESDLRYHDEINGDLFTQVDKTMELLLTKYLKAAISYEGIQRVESYPMPEGALREALLNAVIHRDYAVPAPIQIRVYADRLLIWNPGELPENWSEAKLLSPHPSQPYNPDVANAFFRAGEIEAWGRGIERVLEACREAGTSEPRIRVETGGLWFEFPFSVDYLDSLGSTGNRPKNTRTLGNITQETTQETTQEQIVNLLRQDPTMTRRILAERIGITPDGIKYHLAKLREAGRIRHVGSTKKGHWEIMENGDE